MEGCQFMKRRLKNTNLRIVRESPEGVDRKQSAAEAARVSPHTMSFQKLLPWIGILLLPAIFYLALAGEGSNE